jgi:hypothetical protein
VHYQKKKKHHVSGGPLRYPHKSNRVDPRVALSRQFQADKSLKGRVQFNFKLWVKNHCIGPSLFPFCLSPLLSHLLSPPYSPSPSPSTSTPPCRHHYHLPYPLPRSLLLCHRVCPSQRHSRWWTVLWAVL